MIWVEKTLAVSILACRSSSEEAFTQQLKDKPHLRELVRITRSDAGARITAQHKLTVRRQDQHSDELSSE